MHLDLPFAWGIILTPSLFLPTPLPAVSLAGVASLQKSCQPGWSDALSSIDGFSAGLPCYRLFRYSW